MYQFRFFAIFSAFFLLIACSDDAPVEQVTTTEQSTEVSAEQVEESSSALDVDDGFTVVDGVELDYLLVTRNPDMVNKYVDEFNYRWVLAYDCENASKVKKDIELFKSIEAGIMSSVTQDQSAVTTRFKALGEMILYPTAENRSTGKLGTAQGFKNGFSGSQFSGTDCSETEPMNTRHVIFLEKIKRGLTASIPQKLLDAAKPDTKAIYTVMIIKFNLDSTTYEYFDKGNFFKATHRGAIEEIALYADRQELNNSNPFRVFSADELYR